LELVLVLATLQCQNSECRGVNLEH
jgi:hypothetical protein